MLPSEPQKWCKHISLFLWVWGMHVRGYEGEIRGSLGWECTPSIRILTILEGEKQIACGFTLFDWSAPQTSIRVKTSILHLEFFLCGLHSHLRRRRFGNAYVKITVKAPVQETVEAMYSHNCFLLQILFCAENLRCFFFFFFLPSGRAEANFSLL